MRRQTQIRIHQPRTVVVRRDMIDIVTVALPQPAGISEVLVLLDAGGRLVQRVTEAVVLLPSAPTSRHSPSVLATSQARRSPDATPAAHSEAGPRCPQAARQPAPQSSLGPTHGPSTGSGEASTGGPPARPDGVEGRDSVTAAAELPGITYSPYNADGTCKSGSRVFSDFQNMARRYRLVRIYGVDCSQVATAIPAAKSIGVKLLLGIFALDRLEQQIEEIINAVYAHGDWSVVDSVSVGNELSTTGRPMRSRSSTQSQQPVTRFGAPVSAAPWWQSTLLWPSSGTHPCATTQTSV